MDNILRLTIIRKWYDMTLSGEKPEEYRELKPYWINRLFDINPRTIWEFEDMEVMADSILNGYKPEANFRNFSSTHFTNGYGVHRPSFSIECKGISIGIGKPEWGAPVDKPVFIIHHGNILK